MYPLLETHRLLLTPTAESDADDVYMLLCDPQVMKTIEGDGCTCFIEFEKEHIKAVNSGFYVYYIIRIKQSNNFVGFIAINQKINKKKNEIKYSQIGTAILPEYWGQGFCTEALIKLLHFAFVGIKTPLIYANQFLINPAAAKVLKKCGFIFYRKLKMKKNKTDEPYNQYRLFKENYKNITQDETIYDYILPVKKSPYSFENPVRVIDSITYVKEPTGYLCGQSVIAMLADVSVDEVINVMQTDRGTSVAEIDDALTYYGIKHVRTRKSVHNDTVLPQLCILSLQLPGYGHWSLYYKGTYYDPEFGVSKGLPPNAKLCYYWEINI